MFCRISWDFEQRIMKGCPERAKREESVGRMEDVLYKHFDVDTPHRPVARWRLSLGQNIPSAMAWFLNPCSTAFSRLGRQAR